MRESSSEVEVAGSLGKIVHAGAGDGPGGAIIESWFQMHREFDTIA